MQNTYPQKFLRKRKFMMVLPVLTLPFLTLGFWAMGGGKGNAQESKPIQTGLNLQLPEPRLVDESKENKLSFYDKAQEDSIKLRLEMQNDPYYKNGLDTMEIPQSISTGSVQTAFTNRLNNSTYYPSGVSDPNETKIYERLDALNKAIQHPAETKASEGSEISYKGQNNKTGDFSADVDRLEDMMQIMGNKETDDPEMKQIGTMLDKILDIQHPERVKYRLKEKSVQNKTQVFAVSGSGNGINASFLGSGAITNDSFKNQKHNGFYGPSIGVSERYEDNAIAAVIHEAQTLTTGSTVKLRLLTDIYVNGILISKGSFVFGTAALADERLLINIPGIRCGNNLLPVSLSVYDMDGLAGIYIPESISRDVAKQSADQSLQGIEIMSLDPSFKAQAASAGIQAAKGLLSKKIKLVKVNVKAGYKVLLKDGNKQAN